MKHNLVIAALVALTVHAQAPKASGTPGAKAPVKGKCEYTKDVKSSPNPLALLAPGSAVFPCDMGVGVPLGPVPKGCAELEVIVARGTSEPGDFGVIVGDPLVARVKRDLPGVNVRGYPVQYTASMLAAATGITDVGKRLTQQANECPNEKFALAGYSQGGMVVQGALGSIPANLRDKVVAVVLYGAGDGSSVNAAFKTKTIANCAPGDFACSSSGSGPGHVSYNDEGTKWHDRSSSYIVAAYQGKGQGAKTMRSPTLPL